MNLRAVAINFSPFTSSANPCHALLRLHIPSHHGVVTKLSLTGCNRDACMIGLLWKVIILNPRVKNSYMYLVLTMYCCQLCSLVFFFDHKALEKKSRNNLTWYRSGARDGWEGMKCTMYPGCQRLFLRGLCEDFRHTRERSLWYPLSEE